MSSKDDKNSLFCKINKEKKKILKSDSLDDAKKLTTDLLENSSETDIVDKIAMRVSSVSSLDSLAELFNDLKRIEKVYDDINQGTNNVTTLLHSYSDSFIVIRDKEDLKDYINKANVNKELAIDTETTGLNVYQDKIVGLCLYTPGKKEAYIPINHVDFVLNQRLENQLTEEDIYECLSDINKDVEIQMHNADFDIRVLRRIGIYLTCGWDTLIVGHLLNENEDHGLKSLHQKYVLKDKEDEFSFGKLFSTKIMTFADIPIDVAAIYAAHDAKITKELRDFQYSVLTRPNRKDLQEIYDLFKNVELPCIDAICNMEDTGFALDMEYQKVLHEKYNKLLKEEEDKLYTELSKFKDDISLWRTTEEANVKEQKKDKEGNLKFDKNGNPEYAKSKNEQLPEGDIREINLASPTQLGIILYDIMGLKHSSKKDGARSTSEEALKSINNNFTNMILKFRSFSKMVDAFIDSLPEHLEADGKIHCSLNQYGAKTGRMSCIAEGEFIECSSGRKPIEEVNAGDLVYCFDNSGKLTTSVVTNKFNNGIKDCYVYRFVDWKSNRLVTLRCTPDHLICVAANKYIKACELISGDSVINGFIYHDCVGSAEKLQVWDLEVENYHNFIVSEICVHNCSNPNLQQIPAGNDEIRKLFVAPTNYREVEDTNNKFIFKNTEEVDVSGNEDWVFVKDLKEGDVIQNKEIININNSNLYIEIEVR